MAKTELHENEQELERALDSLGITAKLEEHPEKDSITVVVEDISRLREPTEAAAKALAAQFLPAHLLIEYDFSQVTL